jgi:hypothetical protein
MGMPVKRIVNFGHGNRANATRPLAEVRSIGQLVHLVKTSGSVAYLKIKTVVGYRLHLQSFMETKTRRQFSF